MRILQDKKGSVTLEAAIAMIVTIAACVTMSMVIRVIYIEAYMQNALTQTANEIAMDCYYLSATGIKQGLNDFNEVTGEGRRDVNEKIGAVFAVEEAFSNGANAVKNIDLSQESIEYLYDTSDELIQSGENLVNEVKDVSQDPQKALKHLLGAAANKGTEALTSAAVSRVAVFFMEKHLAQNGMTGDEFLKKQLVVDGLNGVDFSGSSLFKEDNDTIDLVVRYKIRVPSPIPIVKEFNILQRAKARVWSD